LTTLLGQVLTLNRNNPHRQNVTDLVSTLHAKYQNTGAYFELKSESQSQLKSSFVLMLHLTNFFDDFQMQLYTSALRRMKEEINILPFGDDLNEKVDNFKMLPECATKNFAEIILATEACLYNKYVEVKSGNMDRTRSQELEKIKVLSKTLLTYAELIPFHMPADTNAKMLKYDVYMA